MAKEYIEREVLLKKAIYVCEDGYDGADMVLVKHIKAIPAADVAPVVHGRWKQMKVFRTQYVCSECGDIWPDFRSNYCPNCGCRMDGGNE